MKARNILGWRSFCLVIVGRYGGRIQSVFTLRRKESRIMRLPHVISGGHLCHQSVCVAVGVLLLVAGTSDAQACGWFYQESAPTGYVRTDWMSELPDGLRISQLSVPGTHDAMARCGGLGVTCQSLRLDRQLEMGVRALDIRCRRYQNHFDITHNCFMQGDNCGALANHYEFDDALCICVDFLLHHPDETILMRVADAGCPFSPFRSFEETYLHYTENRGCACGPQGEWVRFGDFIWSDSLWSYGDSLPTLGDVRGKIVVLQDFPAAGRYGPDWGGFDIQDEYTVYYTCHGKTMDWKWGQIWDQVWQAANGDMDQMYVNFTSASGGIFPRDVARGLTVFWCFAYEDGMNKRLYQHLQGMPAVSRLGMVMMDYPGAGLIDLVISKNGLASECFNDAPFAVAGGPYEGPEGSRLIFDGSDSSDADGDTLLYRWDVWDVTVVSDTTFETLLVDSTDWSHDPTASYTWYDDDYGIVRLQVTDGLPGHVVEDMALVTVHNAAPEAAIDSLKSPVAGCILPGQDVEFYGSFSDPGAGDTHTAQWVWGDGESGPAVVEEEHEIPDATGAITGHHAFGAPGTYTVVLEVTDDDGGGTAVEQHVRIRTAVEAVRFLDSVIVTLPKSVFRGQAEQRKSALSGKCGAVENALEAGQISGAMKMLMADIRAHTDGLVSPVSRPQAKGNPERNDWVRDAGTQARLCLIIDELVKYLATIESAGSRRMVAATGSEAADGLPARLGQNIAYSSRWEPTEKPRRFGLDGAYPNPFNPQTTIAYAIPEQGLVTLKVYDVQGRLVRTIVNEEQPEGEHSAVWQGRDKNGSSVASGIYFVQLNCGSNTQTRKVVLLK